MEALKKLIESSPWGAALGVQVESLAESAARLRLPYKDENSNPGKVLHGGVAASLADLAALAVGRAALGESAGPIHTAGLQVSYLAAAIGEEVVSDATMLRKGKELCFIDVAISTADGKPIARGLSTVRGRFGMADAAPVASRGDSGFADPGIMGPHLPKRVAFIGRLGMSVENMSQGEARIAMPLLESNTDETGAVAEGPLLALLDTTGAMAAWAATGPGPYKASTVGMQAQLRGARPKGDVIAYGKMAHRDKEIFWCEAEVACKATSAVVAAGTVIYRIVIPEPGGVG